MTVEHERQPTTKLEKISLSPFLYAEAEGDLFPHTVRPPDPGVVQIISWLNRNIPKIEGFLKDHQALRDEVESLRALVGTEINATKIGGIEVDVTSPGDTQVMTYVSATGKIDLV